MKKTILLLMMSIFCFGLNAQWKTYQTDAKVVNQMFEDSKGNLWFFNKENLMASCLAKFDGQKVENYAKLGDVKTNCVFKMVEDKQGTLYIATIFGLAAGDGKNWTIYNKNNGLPSNIVKDMHFDKNGDFWIFVASGFNSGQVAKFNNNNYQAVSMDGHSGKSIKIALEDKDGLIWTGMHLGNAASFDGTKWTDYTGQANCKHVSQIAQDKKGRIWIAGIEGQFACYDGGKWKSFKHGSGYFSPYSAPLFIIGLLPGIIAGYAGPDISSYGDIVADQNSDAWFLARKRGVVVSDGIDYETSEKKYNSPNTKKVTDIMVDSKGNIWMTVFSGEVLKYNFSEWTVYNQKDGLPTKLSGIFETKNGDIWVGGKKAVAVLKNQ